jgi:hypothetical protein
MEQPRGLYKSRYIYTKKHLRVLLTDSVLVSYTGGLRLDECSEPVQTAVHELIRASTSTEGYQKILGCTLMNGFLGHLVNGRRVLNEHSYNFRLLGEPSRTESWAYTFFGHHLCLSVFVKGKRIVIGPTFLGAEPDRIDEGPSSRRSRVSISCAVCERTFRKRRVCRKRCRATLYLKDDGILLTKGWMQCC